MALKDFFKRKKPKEEKIEKKEAKKKVEPVEKPKEAKKEPVAPSRKIKKITGEAYRVLKTPHITERATDLTRKNQYVFKIWPKANKTQVKKAIESVFGVDVTSVQIINVPKKKRRLGRIEGFRKGYKKAIVRIKEGQKIEVLPR
jgi:large subunit ribosomal protein L23